MLNVILYPWSDCAIYSGHFIEISTEVEKSHWHHVVSVTLTSKRCNFKIKPQICISTWVLLIIKCFGCPWIFFWGIHGWHDVSVTCCQHEFVSKGCFKLNHLLVHVSWAGVYFQRILQSLLASGFGCGLPMETSWYEFFHVVPRWIWEHGLTVWLEKWI